jgi:hypothetical protein
MCRAPRRSSAPWVSPRKGWASTKRVLGPTPGHFGGAMRGQATDPGDADLAQKFQRLILDHVGQRPDDQQLVRCGFGQHRHHGGEAGILALGEGRLDPRPNSSARGHAGRAAR